MTFNMALLDALIAEEEAKLAYWTARLATLRTQRGDVPAVTTDRVIDRVVRWYHENRNEGVTVKRLAYCVQSNTDMINHILTTTHRNLFVRRKSAWKNGDWVWRLKEMPAK